MSAEADAHRLHAAHGGVNGTTTIASPEDHTRFRLAQLIILLGEIAPANAKGINLERIGYYDFFAANPFAMIDQANTRDRARLHRAAFNEGQLSYASTGSRFANRRQRLQHDLALLVAFGLVEPRTGGYGATEQSVVLVEQFHALYADQYRESVRVVHRHLRRLSEPQLAASARRWLRSPSLILDLYGVPAATSNSAVVATLASDGLEGHLHDQ
jgi:hypothetical protein